MKKEYEMPVTTVVKVATEMLLIDSDSKTVHKVNGAGLQYGGGNTEAARGRGGNDWSDE